MRPLLVSLLCILSYAPVWAQDLLIPAQQLKTESGKRYYIISIGINEYEDSFWPGLKWPKRDAVAVSNSFGKETDSQVVNISVLNENATLNNVVRILTDIKGEATGADTVILYVSGHGSLAIRPDGDVEPVAVMHDSQNDDLIYTGLSHTYLKTWLDGLAARKKMIIMATCHSGLGKSRVPAAVQNLLARRKGQVVSLADVSEGSLILAAAAQGEAALEDDVLEGDVYTHFLLEALSNYDRNRDGMVSALEAHDYAREQTWIHSKGKQRPTADVRLIGDADIALAGRKLNPAFPLLEAYDESLAGYVLEVDRIKGRLPHAFVLNPSGSRVRLYAPGSEEPLGHYAVNLSKGERIDLHQVISYRPLMFAGQLYHYRWQQDHWQSLSGNNNIDKPALVFAGRWQQYQLGLIWQASEQSSHNYRNNLKVHLDLMSRFFFAGWVKRFGHWQMDLNLLLGQETLNILFQDQINLDEIDFSKQSMAIGGLASLSYNFYPDAYVNLQAGQIRNEWQMEQLGKFNGNRWLFSLGVSYQFGIKARSL